MEHSLKRIAEYYGYSGELPDFLDFLERYMLCGAGHSNVAEALEHRFSKETIVKIALANLGNAFGDDLLPKGKEDKWTFEEQAKQGEDEFNRHLDKNGKFSFSDYKKENIWMGLQESNPSACSKTAFPPIPMTRVMRRTDRHADIQQARHLLRRSASIRAIERDCPLPPPLRPRSAPAGHDTGRNRPIARFPHLLFIFPEPAGCFPAPLLIFPELAY